MLDYHKSINTEKLEEIHNSLVNGQRSQMVKQIDEYGLYDFWADYEQFLGETADSLHTMMMRFNDAVISYHRIKSR